MIAKNIILHDALPDASRFSDFAAYRSVLVQVFAATPDRAFVGRVLAALKTALPHAVIIGCSTDGTIDNGSIHDFGATVQLTLTGFEQSTLQLAFSEQTDDAFELGRTIAEKLAAPDTRAIISFSEAASVNGEMYLEGMFQRAPGITVAGGIASTPTFTDTYLIADDRILSQGSVAVALRSASLHVYNDFLFGWEPIGREMTVTDVDNNIIKKIDNRSPLAIFRHYLGDEISDALPGTGSAFPLLLKRGDHFIARGIIALDGESFVVSGNVKKDDKVYIGYGNPSLIAQKKEFYAHLQQRTPAAEAVFNYYCEGRHLFLPEDAVRIEAETLSESGFTAGCFTLGEYYTHHKNILHNFSSTVLMLTENSGTRTPSTTPVSHQIDAHEQLSAIVTKGLFHLIDVRTKELEHQSYHDELTALPNRTFFNEMLSLELKSAQKASTRFALLFLDLDHFKDVNDTLGHGSGDLLLQTVARRINTVLHPSDLFARWGGDEFIILRHDSRPIESLVDLATKVLDLFDEPIDVDGHLFSLGVSIGISLYPNDGADAESLIKHADAAMYDVKYGGRNHFSFYRREMTEKALRRISLENDLRAAVKEKAFFLLFQPQVDLESGTVRRAEALLRWQHPEKGVIMPDTFIPIAEHSGLIIPIGEYIFDMALQAFSRWKQQGLAIDKICVNVSARQFRDDNIVATVERYLDKYGLRPHHLEIELTESTLMKNSRDNVAILDALHRLGVSISIDDFGTGYSSLSYLQRFRINNIKIDKSFVTHLPQNTNDEAIVKAIIAMAHTLGLEVVVEGIETPGQKAFFDAQGCAFAQGYYFGKPLEAARFESLLLR